MSETRTHLLELIARVEDDGREQQIEEERMFERLAHIRSEARSERAQGMGRKRDEHTRLPTHQHFTNHGARCKAHNETNEHPRKDSNQSFVYELYALDLQVV